MKASAEKGGARPGAGRKKGSPNKASQKRQEQIASTGSTPLDVIIRRMRYHESLAIQALEAKDTAEGERHLREADDAARAAAPYVHPKLQAIQHTGRAGGPIEMREVPARDAVASRIARLAARRGQDGDPR